MRIRMTNIECGPAGNYQPGDERDLPADHAAALVTGGHAVYLEPAAMEQAVLSPEFTAPAAPEVTAPKKAETRTAAKKAGK